MPVKMIGFDSTEPLDLPDAERDAIKAELLAARTPPAMLDRPDRVLWALFQKFKKAQAGADGHYLVQFGARYVVPMAPGDEMYSPPNAKEIRG